MAHTLDPHSPTSSYKPTPNSFLNPLGTLFFLFSLSIAFIFLSSPKFISLPSLTPSCSATFVPRVFGFKLHSTYRQNLLEEAEVALSFVSLLSLSLLFFPLLNYHPTLFFLLVPFPPLMSSLRKSGGECEQCN